MKHLRYLLMAALVAMPLIACDEDDDPPIIEIIYGTVSGTVQAEGDGLANVSVSLVGATTQTTTTAAGGGYSFTNVEAGSYGITINASAHSDVSFPITSKTTTIAVQGETKTVDFPEGSYIRTGSITGTVTASGAPLAGVPVVVAGGPDVVDIDLVSDAAGRYVASGLRAGSYTVTITAPTGVNFTNGTSAPVTVSLGLPQTADFPGEAVQMASITGAVTIDGNAAVGIVVTLSAAGAADVTTETGAQGAYSFVNLTPGEYTVTITPGMDDTYPDGLSQVVVVAAGETGVASFAGEGPSEPATISIGAMTRHDGMGNVIPLDLTNVFGQIEVTANLERNDQTLDYVDVLIGDVVVATQQFQIPGAPAAMVGDVEAVVLSVPTTQVMRAPTGGAAWTPAVKNGARELSLNLYVVESPGKPIPTNKVPIVMQNKDLIIPGDDFGGNLSFLPDTPAQTAEGASLMGSTTWYSGSATFTGPQFLAYSTEVPTSVLFTATTCAATAPGSIVGTAGPEPTVDDTGITVSNTYSCAGVEGNVLPDHNTFAVTYGTAVGPDGTAIMTHNAMSAIGAEFYLGDGTIGPRRFVIMEPIPTQITASPDLNMDNKGPTVWVDGDGTEAGTLVAFRDMFDEPWVNAAHTFVLFDGTGDLDPAGDVQATDGGVGLDDAATVALDYDWGGTFGVLGDDTCTDVVKTTGDDYAETQASDGTPDGWKICAKAQDLLGNSSKSGDSNYFGVDKVNPIITPYDDTAGTGEYSPVLGNVDGSIFSSVSPDGSYDTDYRWGYEAIDGRSGFDMDYWYDGGAVNPTTELFPAMQQLVHYPGSTGLAPEVCDVFEFDNTLNQIAPGVQEVRSVVAEFTCGGAGNLVEPGYYVYTNMVTDRAGNSATLGTTTYAVDDVSTGGAAPLWSLFQFVNGFYSPGVPAGFQIFATDDLEVIEAEVSLVHPFLIGATVLVNYGWGQIDGFQRFDGYDVADVSPWDLFDATLFSSAVLGEVVQTPLPVFGRLDITCNALQVGNYASCLEDDGVTDTSSEYNLGADDASMLPTEATAAVRDVGYNVTDLGVNNAFIPAQWDDSTPAPWSDLAPGTAEVIIRRWYGVEVAAGTSYTATMEAPTSIEEPYFDSVALVNNDGGEITICSWMTYDGDNDNGIDRFFNYSGGVAAGSVCDGALGTWHVIGLKGAAGLVSQPIT